MSLLAEMRESKLFKAIADISVLHWLITIGPGLFSGIEAAMHGKPLEVVILYFFGVSALALAALHYGGLAWTKYWPNLKQYAPSRPSSSKLWRLIVPAAALVVVVIVGWPKPKRAIPPALTASSQGASQQQATKQPEKAAQQNVVGQNTRKSVAGAPKKTRTSSRTGPAVQAALRETSPTPVSSFADDLAEFIDKGTAINQHFIDTDDTVRLYSDEKDWTADVEQQLEVHLGHSYALQFRNAQGSAWMGCPFGRSVTGCALLQRIKGKINVLSGFVAEVRQKPPQTIIGVPGGVTAGSITQGAGSALSIDQQGGVTAGTYIGDKPADCSVRDLLQNVATPDGRFKSTFAVNLVTSHAVSLRISVVGLYVVDIGWMMDPILNSTSQMILNGSESGETIQNVPSGNHTATVYSSRPDHISVTCHQL